MILTLTPNPCVDKTVFVSTLEPGTFIHAKRYSCVAGGKGTNVSRALHVLGGTTLAMVVVGGNTGREVVRLIEADGVPCQPIWVQSPTRTITTVLEETRRRQTALFEPGSRVSEDEAEAIKAAFRGAVIGARVAAFCGTVPDPTLRSLYRDLITTAKEAGVVTILDSHGPEFAAGLEAKPHLIKPNAHEAEEVLGISMKTRLELLQGIAKFHEMGIEFVVISLGKDGALVSWGDEQIHVRPPAIEEVNPVGSGDALVAGLAIGLSENWSLEKMATIGVAAGTANAITWEIGKFTRERVESLASQITVEKF